MYVCIYIYIYIYTDVYGRGFLADNPSWNIGVREVCREPTAPESAGSPGLRSRRSTHGRERSSPAPSLLVRRVSVAAERSGSFLYSVSRAPFSNFSSFFFF